MPKETVCLITPPSIFLLDERVFVSLGILKVAAVLERSGYAVEHLDLSGIQNFEEALEDHARTSPAIWFGLTSTTPQLPAVAKIIRRIRAARPDAKVVLGGPHPTLVQAAFKREQKLGIVGRGTKAMNQLLDMCNVVVAGDGEDAILQVLRSTGILRLVDADDPKGPLFLTNKRLEETPFPARHLVDFGSYNYSVDGVKATSLVAQLGCPFGCRFCGGRESSMLRKIRTRSTVSILRELEMLYTEHGIKGFMFYDDELNVSKSLVELMQGIVALQERLGVEFRLRGFVKSELFKEDQAEWMYRAGFRWLLCGFESGHPRILSSIAKRATVEDNFRMIEVAHKHKLKVKALMSVGHPGESEETVRATQDWLLQAQPEDFDVTIITTYPGTPYYDHAVETSPGIWTYTVPENGDRLHSLTLDYTETADYYKGDPDGGYTAYVYTDHLSSTELVRLRDDVERTVRAKLNIPFNAGAAAIRYEHSMGQTGPLPANILRSTK